MSIKWLHKNCEKKYLELEQQFKKEVAKNKAIISIINNNDTLKALFLEERDKKKIKNHLAGFYTNSGHTPISVQCV